MPLIPEKVAMPDLVDLTFRQAGAKLESFGLKVGHITYEPNMGINMCCPKNERLEVSPAIQWF